MKHYIVKNQKEIDKRVDLFLSETIPSNSRSYYQKLIDRGRVTVNHKLIKPSYKLKLNDDLSVDLDISNEPDRLVPENIPLDIVFENDDVIVLNKQPGMVVHPAAGNKSGTLVNALLNYFPKIKNNVSGDDEHSKNRPGLVHRLDKDTSGLMVVAKNPKALKNLSKQIKNRTIEKKYIALCYGWPKEDRGQIISHLGRDPKNRQKIKDVGDSAGRRAISKYQVKDYYRSESGEKISLIEFDLETGRTHQIRVQAKQINLAILGDEVYGNKNSLKLSREIGITRQLLHSKYLSLKLPSENKKMIFELKMPDDFKAALKQLVRSE